MLAFLRPFSALLSLLSRLALWIAGIGLVAMTAIVAWQVYGRYVLGSTPRYAEAAAVLLMSWFIFLGAAVGVRERYHLGFDILLHISPKPVKRVLRYLSDVFVFGFGLGMAIYGWRLAAYSWKVRIPTLGLSSGLPYVPIVIGGVLICLFTLERILLRATGQDVDEAAAAAKAAEEAALSRTLAQE